MNDFAQTGAQQEDLFDDVVYANGEESMQTRGTEDLFFGDDFTPAEEPIIEQPPVHSVPQPTRGRGGRGRGGRGRDRQRNQNGVKGSTPSSIQTTAAEDPKVDTPAQATPFSLLSSRHAPQPHEQPRSRPQPKAEAPAPTEPSPQTDIQPQAQAQAQIQPDPQSTTPSQVPDAEQPQRLLAVRGDRSATGGNARKKLTETELAEKMSRISLKNATLEAAHARAQADAESFAKNEAEAAKRRREERRDRQQMMGEREKNRLRKLKAQEGREWDSEKVADETGQGRGYGRGAHSGVVGTIREERSVREVREWDDGGSREYMYRENRGRGRGRGGRGRGAADGADVDRQSLPLKEDFPALPAAAPRKEATNGEALNGGKRGDGEKQAREGASAVPVETQSLEIKEGQKWADMVEE